MTDISLVLPIMETMRLADPGSLLIPLLVGAGTAYATTKMQGKPPKPEAPTRMPDPLSPEVVEERRRRVAQRQAASGRESTILSDDNYSNSVLGE
jgi:hypothetical protein